jgi:hypothetical protein
MLVEIKRFVNWVCRCSPGTRTFSGLRYNLEVWRHK